MSSLAEKTQEQHLMTSFGNCTRSIFFKKNTLLEVWEDGWKKKKKMDYPFNSVVITGDKFLMA